MRMLLTSTNETSRDCYFESNPELFFLVAGSCRRMPRASFATRGCAGMELATEFIKKPQLS